MRLVDRHAQDREHAAGVRRDADERGDFVGGAVDEKWRAFVPAVSASSIANQDEDGSAARLTIDGPVSDLEARFLIVRSAHAADARAIDGEAKGARIRWDVRELEAGRSEVALRANLCAPKASLVYRAAIAIQPLFEHALHACIAIALMESVLLRAQSQAAARH